MTETPATYPVKKPTAGSVSMMFIIYSLHGFCVITGLLTPAFIMTVFLTGWPSLLALLLSYWKQGDAADTWLTSHYRWTIRTFWFAVLWLVIAAVCFALVIPMPLALLILLITGAWVVYRILRGVFRLMAEKPMPI